MSDALRMGFLTFKAILNCAINDVLRHSNGRQLQFKHAYPKAMIAHFYSFVKQAIVQEVGHTYFRYNVQAMPCVLMRSSEALQSNASKFTCQSD